MRSHPCPRRVWFLLATALLLLFTLASPARIARAQAPQAPALSPVLTQFDQRVEAARRNLPTILAAAQAAADRSVAHPQAGINVPYSLQASFAEELVNRAGGLANAFPPEERMNDLSEHDVLLASARCWETDADQVRTLFEKYRKPGNLVVLFASKAGMPDDIEADFIIDNAAADGSAVHAPINALANVLQAWIWTCEYAAAMTRQGKHPGLLYSITMPGSKEHNKALQSPRSARKIQGDTDQPIPALQLANAYLARVEQLQQQLASAQTQQSIEKAARTIVDQLAAGGQVAISTCTHVLLSEIMWDRITPMQPFHSVWRAKSAFAKNMQQGGLLVWMGYVGLSTVNEDYGAAIRSTGARLITSFVTDELDAANNAPEALVHIEQHWTKPDAELKVPFPPGVIAPVSGLDQGLIYRTLEARVAQLLQEKETSAK